MSLPQGAYAPIPTPLGESGLFDPVALERHLDFLSKGGLDGALVMGTNGEFPSFDLNERMAVADAAARLGKKLSLMLGVGSCALPEARHLVSTAHYLGFSSVLVPPPFYFRSASTKGLIAFFADLLEAAELPVLLYHIPQVTGVPISDEILDSVLDHPRFGGVKDSSGDEKELERFRSRLADRSYMVGHDRLVTRARMAGGYGSITASASVVPNLVASTQRDADRQPELDRVRSLLESYGLGPAVKAVLRHKDIGAYRSRPPLLDLDPDSEKRLIQEFDDLTSGNTHSMSP
jgi:4-hydroxy-tetrahydrodipicolinate synthase